MTESDSSPTGPQTLSASLRGEVWPSVPVVPFSPNDAVVWGDGKPRCAVHPGTVLVARYAVGLNGPGHVCARCMREALRMSDALLLAEGESEVPS